MKSADPRTVPAGSSATRPAPADSPAADDTTAARYVGRFAPSPSGPLHFGSLIGALASFLDARAAGGRWLLRIEDIDPQREVAGAAAAILDCLRAHGLSWDGAVLHQSERIAIYRDVCDDLIRAGLAFYCTCSRTTLDPLGGIYGGRCRGCDRPPAAPAAIRLQVAAGRIAFDDAVQGHIAQDLEREVGDFVIYRKEKLPAYQLAVVVDDAAQGVTHVVRGSDLLDSTPRQIYLQRQLGYLQRQPGYLQRGPGYLQRGADCAQPRYAHVPVIANARGQKLSKQTLAKPLDARRAATNLRAALDFLHQPAAPRELVAVDALLQWAIAHWDLARVPALRAVGGAAVPPSCRAFIV